MTDNTKIRSLEGNSPLQDLLRRFSVEVLPKDSRGIDAACDLLEPNAEVFVASLPNENADALVAACARLRRGGLIPVPHLAARNIRSLRELDETLCRLSTEAGVDHALVLGGDRDNAVGPFSASIDLIETGLLQKHGIGKVAFGCHPEGHPRVVDEVMWPALKVKIDAAHHAGLETYLVSQFAFAAEPIVGLAQRVRAAGITAPLRVGVAGPAAAATLIKYAVMCGVGPSLRALKERQALAKAVATGETPEELLLDVIAAFKLNPALGLDGVHFFTFGSLENSVRFAQRLR